MKHKVAVIGLGYVGLPLAVHAEGVGHDVIAIDLDVRKIDSLLQGRSYIEDVPDETLVAMRDRRRFAPTTKFADATGFEIAIITVPTPLNDGLPNLSYVESAAASIAPYITSGATVVLESTTYPGTTEDVLIPILEQQSGMKAGKDFSVGFSPERIDPGNTTWTLKNTPKIVSGIDEDSLSKISAFYRSFVDVVVPTVSTKEAELAKLLENTFRHVNIALVNELAMYAHELSIDIWDTIDAAASKPFGFMKFTPGPGVGGHCLPIDPSYLSWQVKRTLGKDFRFVGLANDINDHMPDFVVQRAMEKLNAEGKSLNGSRVLALGLAYKPDSGDCRESPATRIVELLQGFGANVVVADPHVTAENWPMSIERVAFEAEQVRASDLVVIVTNHREFDFQLLHDFATPVLDTRNSTTNRSFNLF